LTSVFARTDKPAPSLAFVTLSGRPRTLEDFRGGFILVNLWATWCGPCVREMPSLDRAQAKLGDRLRILAISEDKRGEKVVGPFLTKLAPAHLAVFLDAPNAASRAFNRRVLPTSYLIDRSGRIVASLEGSVEWDSPRVIAALEAYLAQDQAKRAETKSR
jgi:thiol-disulfide isomerase/thioredoxin